jgi:hypothetical protein
LFDIYINSTIGEDDLFSLYPWISELVDSKKPIIRNSSLQYEPLGAILGQVIKANEFPFIEAIQQDNQILYHPLVANDTPFNWCDIGPGDCQVVEGVISD